MRLLIYLLPVALLSSCRPRPAPEAQLTVAAAANLVEAFREAGAAFKAKTGVDVVFSHGSTAQLARQIENGAPFDLFAAADTANVDALIAAGKLTAESRAVYASGQLALWIPDPEKRGVRDLKDLNGPAIRFIAIAQPDLAPYGKAAVEALQKSGQWEALKPKLVYANSVSQAHQMAQSGNADAAFTAFSLLLRDAGTIVKIDPGLYSPIEQALAILAGTPRTREANLFRAFLLGPEGRAILLRNGYLLP